MCGIWAYFYFKTLGSKKWSVDELKPYINKIQHRGPDNTVVCQLPVSEHVVFGFHRLAIIDTSHDGDQPLSSDGVYLICNGEIYNYRELYSKYYFTPKGGSDCEVILHMYKTFGIEKTVRELDGVFAFVLYDSNSNKIYAARDPVGVRPLFVSQDAHGLFFCSEVKGIPDERVSTQFEPGTYYVNDWNRYMSMSLQYKSYVPRDLIDRKSVV